MEEEVEIEYKNTLSPTEYQTLINEFEDCEQRIKHLHNMYYDTADRQLKARGMGLRIRQADNYQHLTLKVRQADQEMWEYTEILSVEEVTASLAQGRPVIKESLKQVLNQAGITWQSLEMIGHFQTLRRELPYQGQLLVLDACQFDHYQDYELEMEVNNSQKGWQIFQNFLEERQIERRPAAVKVARMQATVPDYTF